MVIIHDKMYRIGGEAVMLYINILHRHSSAMTDENKNIFFFFF
jgi:hypothetical protein